MTYDNGIIYENDFATVREFEQENRPYGYHSWFTVTHKTLSSVVKVFNEHDFGNAKQLAIDWCDSYERQRID